MESECLEWNEVAGTLAYTDEDDLAEISKVLFLQSH